MADIIERILPNILEWKKLYGTIYYLKAGNGHYIYRALSRAEYTALLSIGAVTSLDLSDLILKTCLLYPKYNKTSLNKKLAGEVESVILAINSCSGFSETDKVITDIDAARASMGSLENQMEVLICKAFPHLIIQDIEKFNYSDLVKYVALSEEILGVKLKIEKPENTKGGPINFEEENKSFNEPPPFGNKNKHRGAPDK